MRALFSSIFIGFRFHRRNRDVMIVINKRRRNSAIDEVWRFDFPEPISSCYALINSLFILSKITPNVPSHLFKRITPARKIQELMKMTTLEQANRNTSKIQGQYLAKSITGIL